MAPVGEFSPGESAGREAAAGSSSPVLALPGTPSQSRPVTASSPAVVPQPHGPTLLDLLAVGAVDEGERDVLEAADALFDAVETNSVDHSIYVPVARLTDPETAHEAAHRARSRSAADADLVLKAHARAGEQGLTGYELEKATGRPYQSVGPRRPALEAAGLIVKAQGVRRPNARGNAEQVYRITADGMAAARLLEVAA